MPDIAVLITCIICHGSGQGQLSQPCTTCNGTGKVPIMLTIDTDALTVLSLALSPRPSTPETTPADTSGSSSTSSDPAASS